MNVFENESNAIGKDLLEEAKNGDKSALSALFSGNRERLARMVRLRMDRRLKGRLDASDIIQETFLEAAGRFEEYAHDPDMPFFLWLRFLAMQKLMVMHRKHLSSQARDVRREIPIYRGDLPEASSAALAAQLVGECTSPSAAVQRDELEMQLHQALEGMDPIDREVLALRHFEQLTNVETSRVLGLAETAASQRYVRAIMRLKDILSKHPGFQAGMSR